MAMLKMYDLTDPRTGKSEEVYEYLSCDLPPWMARAIFPNCIGVTRTPMTFPLIVAPTEYLKEKPNLRTGVTNDYVSLELAYYFHNGEPNQDELTLICEKILAVNPNNHDIVNLKNQVMKITKGKGDVALVTTILKNKLVA
jgi:hypothetical protein